MTGRRKKPPREKDLTARFLTGDFDEDRIEQSQRFSDRSKNAQQSKIERTALLRAAEGSAADIESLPAGQVVQVYSLFIDVEHETGTRLCVVRKTLNKTRDTAVVVGDWVRFRDTGSTDDQGRPEAVIEAVLPRTTVLTRADSFKGAEQHALVANAQQMLIVASIVNPIVKWGLVDRMIVAAQSGGLVPIVCLNKIDLADELPLHVLAHYASLGIATIRTSATAGGGVNELQSLLAGKTTVLAGHSGVGKSTLINAAQPGLDLRTGDVSEFTAKGRHTTTFTRRYPLDVGGHVIDTPGVKVFGLWNMTRERLADFFPDIENDTAPPWRVESYERLAASLPEEGR
jgi:ribosome biogenesis GTPase